MWDAKNNKTRTTFDKMLEPAIKSLEGMVVRTSGGVQQGKKLAQLKKSVDQMKNQSSAQRKERLIHRKPCAELNRGMEKTGT